jgi:PAS domain S-box-containing protein
MYSLLNQTEGDNPTDPLALEAESFVKSALDGLSAHIAVLDETGMIIFVNKAWRDFARPNRYFGGQSIIGDNYLSLCDANTDSPVAVQIGRGIRQVQAGQTEEFHLEYPSSGTVDRRWYAVRITRFSWSGIIRLIVSHQDITDTKHAQLELENSKRRLEAILDNLVDGIITFDEHGIIHSLNPAGAYIFGYDRNEIIGQNVRRLIPDLDETNGDEQLVNFLTRLGAMGDEINGRRQDGSLFPMYFAISKIELDGRPVFSAIIQDFTERKYLEEQLWDKARLNVALEKERELRDLKNSFISMMSHDLRTPLASIRLANSMLKTYGDRTTEAEKRESYDTIEAQVEYLAELINDVMTISRTDFTGTELEAEVIDLETYCRDVIEEIQLAYRMQCCIEFTGTNQRVEARIDKKLIRRALTNLLTNAIKYSPEGSPIDVSLTRDQSDAVIRISDHGIGIPENDLKRLFEPFHRASNVGKIQGTGLGLAITKQAVDLHGGAITAESKLGEGTTFMVRLPVIQQPNVDKVGNESQ